MEISHLKIFRTVADLGSVSAAAGQLNCVQSNVTIRIKHLEQELGQALFYRKPRGMILTPSGHLLLKYANQIIHLEKEARKAVSDNTWVRGQLMLGAIESVAAIHLPRLLAKFHGLYPEIELSLITGNSTELNQKVADYELEGAFVTDGYKLPGLEWQDVFQENLVLVCPAGNEPPKTAAQKGILVFPNPASTGSGWKPGSFLRASVRPKNRTGLHRRHDQVRFRWYGCERSTAVRRGNRVKIRSHFNPSHREKT